MYKKPSISPWSISQLPSCLSYSHSHIHSRLSLSLLVQQSQMSSPASSRLSSSSSSSRGSDLFAPKPSVTSSTVSSTPSMRARQEAMVFHLSSLLGVPTDEIHHQFQGDYSIIAPMLARVTSPPSPVLQYPKDEADDKFKEDNKEGMDWHVTFQPMPPNSPPPLMIPPMTAEVIAMVAEDVGHRITPDPTPSPPISAAPPFSPVPSYASPAPLTTTTADSNESYYEAETLDADQSEDRPRSRSRPGRSATPSQTSPPFSEGLTGFPTTAGTHAVGSKGNVITSFALDGPVPLPLPSHSSAGTSSTGTLPL